MVSQPLLDSVSLIPTLNKPSHGVQNSLLYFRVGRGPKTDNGTPKHRSNSETTSIL